MYSTKATCLFTYIQILGFLKSNPLFYIYLGSKKYYDTYFTIIWITPHGYWCVYFEVNSIKLHIVSKNSIRYSWGAWERLCQPTKEKLYQIKVVVAGSRYRLENVVTTPPQGASKRANGWLTASRVKICCVHCATSCVHYLLTIQKLY